MLGDKKVLNELPTPHPHASLQATKDCFREHFSKAFKLVRSSKASG